jgi:hypothetical protein
MPPADASAEKEDEKELVQGPDGRMMTKTALKKELKRLAKLEKFNAKMAKQQQQQPEDGTATAAASKKKKKEASTDDVAATELPPDTTPPGEKKGIDNTLYHVTANLIIWTKLHSISYTFIHVSLSH